MSRVSFAFALLLSSLVDRPDTGTDAAGTGGLVALAVAAGLAVLRWLVKRELAALAERLGAQLAPAHAAAIDQAIDRAAAAIQPRLASLADDALKSRLGTALAGDEAQAILRYLPQAAASLGLTPESVAARIGAALGDPLKPSLNT